MGVQLQVFETVVSFIIVVMLGLTLKRFSVIKTDDVKMLTNLLTKAVLPAVIFLQLSAAPIKSSQLLMVVSIFIAGLLSILVAWIAAKLMKLTSETTGALMLTSSFGASAFIGYPFISFSFPDNAEAMADAVFLSELGVGLPLFLLGPAIAMYFGSKPENSAAKRTFSFSYFSSPIFISVVLGIAVSFVPFNRGNSFIAPFFEALKMINGTMATLACLILALQLKKVQLKGLIPLLVISALIQMWFQPFIARTEASLFHLSAIQTQVLIMISAMPSAVLGPVFASHYNCAPETTTALVMAHILLSIAMIPAAFYFMG